MRRQWSLAAALLLLGAPVGARADDAASHPAGVLAPDDPISVTRDEFDELYAKLADAGVPVRADRDQAWRDFVGWRVNYDRVLISLAAFVMAPYAPWVSDRSPIVPLPHYTLGRRRVAMSRRAQR